MAALERRRSVKPALLGAPGPGAAEIDRILTVAARVPDHKKLAPWRFIVIEGEARAKLGKAAAEVCAAEEKEPPSPVRLDIERQRFLRAPLVVAVVSCLKPSPGAPEWEQVLSAGASCYNLCLAANALGYATNWVTEWTAYSPGLRKVLGLGEGERMAGFIYIGTAKEPPEERERPRLADIVTRWNG
jgi:nitroreductase